LIVVGDRVARFVGERNEQPVIPPFTAIGVEKDGTITAGALFRNFNGCDIEVLVVGNGPASFPPSFVRGIGRYVFNQLGCLRLSMLTDQRRVIDLAERLGARIEGRKRNAFGVGKDAVLLGVLKEEWKFK
jgi:hypothetical protein